MKAWIARDKNSELWIYLDKPSKKEYMWSSNSSDYFNLDNKDFPQVKWEDEEPTEVEITIKIKEAQND